jgi:surface carbohydrate biosynthesis protein
LVLDLGSSARKLESGRGHLSRTRFLIPSRLREPSGGLQPLKTIVLLVDEGPRDALGLVLLAFELVKRGFRAVVSNASMADLVKVFPEAVFFGKSGTGQAMRDGLAADGTWPFPFVFHPAEGAFFQEEGWASSIERKYFLNAFTKQQPDVIMAWGQEQAHIIESFHPQAAAETVVTGSQRLDLCVPKNRWLSSESSKSIQDEFGDFVLITTRFTTILNQVPAYSLFKLVNKGTAGAVSKSSPPVERNRWARDSIDFGIFVEFIQAVASHLPAQKFLLRPHPSENAEIYRLLFSDFPNVQVDRKGNIVPLILAAKALVTSNCTTAVEAVMCGTPTLNLSRFVSKRDPGGITIAREAGTLVSSAEAGVTALKSMVSRDFSPSQQTWSSTARRRLANLSREATPIIADILVDLSSRVAATGLPATARIRKLGRRSGMASETDKVINLCELDPWGLLAKAEGQGYGKGRLAVATSDALVIEPICSP